MSYEKAFPFQGESKDRYGNIEESHFQTGMTLRDYFAAKAMQASISNEKLRQFVASNFGEKGNETMAKSAYILADVMLKERNKTE